MSPYSCYQAPRSIHSRRGWKALPRDREERGVSSKQFREVAMLRGASGSCRRGLHCALLSAGSRRQFRKPFRIPDDDLAVSVLHESLFLELAESPDGGLDRGTYHIGHVLLRDPHVDQDPVR